MADVKYSKYLVKHPVENGPFGAQFKIVGAKDHQSDFTYNILCITKPGPIETFPHSHEFDIYLIFLGFDPQNMGDLGAEVEMSFGEEEEKHVINSPTSVFIPRGLVHSPLIFKRVDRPVLFIHATLAPNYIPAKK